MTQNLTGKHAIVTGGGTGIGLAIAQAYAAAGAEVTITGRRARVLEEVADGNPRMHPLVMDVADEVSVVDGTAAAVAARGPIAICIANAGIAEGRAIHKSSMDDWHKIMRTNLDGAFLTIRESLRSMRHEDWGRVIGISSIAGIRGLKGAAAYSASKHAVIGLIRSLAEDYMGRGITFNSICPGFVATAIIDKNIESITKRAGVTAEEALAMMVSENAHGKLIAPEEIAAAALWLVGDGSQSVNGQNIEIAGGHV
ncbi:MAG: SDR family NAD(P)-dependent oxidoreductase [Paracoccaceae bacterium]